MIPTELPKYAAPHLENKAAKLLRDSGDAGITIPIDIELLLDNLDGVKLDVMRGLQENHGIQGAVMRDLDSGEILVFIDERLADSSHLVNRYRSTVAEEMGHVILHRHLIEAVETVEDFRALQRHPDWQKVERDAKRFGHALLMPGKVLSDRASDLYSKLVEIAGFSNPDVIKKYLRSELAKEFEVSPESMGYRLEGYPLKVYEKMDEAMKNELGYLP